MSKKTERLLYSLLCLVILAYLMARMFLTGLSNDESATFITFVHTGHFLPFAENTHWSANNHLFNSLLTWCSYQLFGISEWVIRLPNLIAFVFYAYFIFQIGRNLQTAYLRWFFWVLLLTTHYLIEFFAYCRGYGLGMALLAGAIYFLARTEKPGKFWKPLFLSFICISLAVLSNLNLLISYLVWLAWLQYILWRKANWFKFATMNLTALLPLAFFIPFSFELRGHEELYFGQARITGTISTLLAKFTGATDMFSFWVVVLLVSLVFITGVLLLLKRFQPGIFPFFFSFFVLNVAASFAMNSLLDINFPSERTGLHWFFLLAGTIPFLLDQLKPGFKRVFSVVALLVLCPVLVFSVQSLSFYSSADPFWRKEQVPDSFYHRIVQLNQGREFPLSTHCSTSFYTFNMAFKDLEHDSSSINICKEFLGTPPYIADLALIDTSRFMGYLKTYKPVQHDPHSGMTLLKRDPLLKRQPICDSLHKSDKASHKDFTTLLSHQLAPPAATSPLRLDYEIRINADDPPLVSLLTLEIRDTANKVVHYDQLRLDYNQSEFNGTNPIKVSFLVDSLNVPIQKLDSYLWNPHNETFILTSAKVKLYELLPPELSAK